jgi:hypothetical protein
MVSETVRLDPATRFVRGLPGEWFMLREAAEASGVSQFTLRKMIAEDIPQCTPSKYAMFGKIRIYLYTRKDIENIRKYLIERNQVYNHNGQAKRIGRPPTYSKTERKDRSRLYSKAWYWKNRAEILESKGDKAGAAKARAKARELKKELKST